MKIKSYSFMAGIILFALSLQLKAEPWVLKAGKIIKTAKKQNDCNPRLKDFMARKSLKIMKKELRAFTWEAEEAEQILKKILKSPDWPKAVCKNIPFIKQPIIIDGIINEAAWHNALLFENEFKIGEKNKRKNPQTIWRIGWNKKYIFVAAKCFDADIIAKKEARDSQIYKNDCIEVFLMVDTRFKNYWEIIINPAGSIFDAMHSVNLRRGPFLSRVEQTMEGLRIGYKTFRENKRNGYIIEVAIPLSEFVFYSRNNLPLLGDKLSFMLVRIDKSKDALEELWAIRPLLFGSHDTYNFIKATLTEK